MSMTRAPALSLALLGLGTYLILKRKHVLLALLSFAFVWSYSLFPLILAFAAAHAVAVYIAERRIDFGALLASAIGIVGRAGHQSLLPEKPEPALRAHADEAHHESGYTVDVGVEWYPYDTWIMLRSSALAFVILFRRACWRSITATARAT